jgi:2-methylisocitrate lyase-like PEP mutase family enzyme
MTPSPAVTPQTKRRALKAALAGDRLLVAPGVYDMISARIADQAGFGAIYMTGYGIAASYLGLPDAGLATLTDMSERARTIAQGTSAPLIADADTGFGGLLNVAHTVARYEAAGVAAIQIEDQEFPKKCGHTPGRRVIPAADMAAKIRVAVEARTDPDLILIARTDALTGHGIDEALRRAALYAQAGADVIFVESPESEAQMERIGREIDRPLLANMVEGGRTPVLPAERLFAIGYRLAIYPATGFLAAAGAVTAAMQALATTGGSAPVADRLLPFDAMNRLMGFPAVWDFDRRHAE